jgi:RNA polymerase sigma-70 factor, ECF subfamily
VQEKDLISRWFFEYSDEILNFLIYYTGNGEVEDLVQEVFIKAFKQIKNHRSISSPKPWLISIARSVAIDVIRKKKKEREKVIKAQLDFEDPQLSSPEDIYNLNEEMRQMYKGINSLKQSYYDVVMLRGIKELTIKETATVLNWSENKVKVTYHRALGVLEKKLGGMLNE